MGVDMYKIWEYAAFMSGTCSTFVTAVLLSCQIASAQHAHAHAAVGPASLPVIVDGSKNPEKIPDLLAYQHFFTTVSAHPVPTTEERGRQAAQLAPLQLGTGDQQALVTALAAFREQLDGITAAALTATTPDQSAAYQAQKSSLASTTLAGLQLTLTPDGANGLSRYVMTRVKAHIVIYGGPM